MINAKTSLNRAALKGGAATLVLAMLATPVAAFAQTAAADAVAEDETIVVTGSLIKNPNLVLSSPVSVVSAREIEQRQIINAEQLLRDLPGVVPSIGASVNNGNIGGAFVNLRGLGRARNLALIDGDRIVPFADGGEFDLNNVPLALVQRVDILTGGASTTYGADAVSGVVNFVTRQDFTGVDLRATSGLTEKGDGETFRADATIGGNFDGGRGNATVSLGYQKNDPIFQGFRDISVFQVSSTSGRAAGGSPTNTPTTFQLNPTTQVQNNEAGTGFVTPNADGFNFAPFNIFQTPFERFNIFAQAKYEIFDNIEVYGRGMFSKNIVKTIIAPSGIFGQTLNVNINNPFIAPAQRAAICGAIPTLDCATGSTAVVSIPAIYRRTTEVGPRLSNYTTTVFDYKAGIRGDITSGIQFDVHAAYGQSNVVQSLDGYTLNSRIQQALLADNRTTCRTDTSGCVPLNLFGGPGSITPEMVNFIKGQSTIATDAGLSQVRGVISGDSGLTIPSAANGINFAVGAEYRDYSYKRTPDVLSQVPGELGGGGGRVPPFSGGYSVVEGFAEINVPIVEDKPFFDSLSIEAGIRQSKYKIRSLTSPEFDTTTWKVGGTWAPVADVKIRGGYQRAVRAPNIGELFAPVVTGLTSLTIDPCSGTKPVGNANLTAVCIAQGATLSQIGLIADPAAGQANATGGGDPTLSPEVADSFTIGGVLTPGFLPGFSLTVDYFDIRINNAITTQTPDDAIAACFRNITATSAASPACRAIGRTPSTGRLSGGGGLFPGLPRPITNRGRLETSGIDFSAAYSNDVGFATLGLTFNGTYTFRNRFKASADSINRECIGQYSVNCGSGPPGGNGAIQPKFQFNQRTTLDFDTFNVSLLWRHLDPVRYETILTPRVFTGTITGFGPLVGEQVDFNRIRGYDYFDLAGGFNINKNLTLNVLVANLFDKQPPIVGSTLGTTGQNSGNTYPSTYDTFGRRYSATIGLRF